MAAHEHINPYQMKLFATGTEIQGIVNQSTDLQPGEDMSSMWERKQRAASDPEHDAAHGHLQESLATKGLVGHGNDRVHLLYGGGDQSQVALGDAHHRVAAAAHLERTGRRTVFFNLDHHVPGSAAAAPPKPMRDRPDRKFIM